MVGGKIIALSVALVTMGGVLACGGGDDSPVDSTAADAGFAGPAPVTSFVGGDFQLRVNSVLDTCLDGGLALVFMPDGNREPYALQNPTYLPGLSELPHTYTMKLQAPFDDMQLTMEARPGGMGATGAGQSDVLLSLPGSDDCKADMVFDAAVTLETPDLVELTTTVAVSAFVSPTETCPSIERVPCTVTLSMTGTRLAAP